MAYRSAFFTNQVAAAAAMRDGPLGVAEINQPGLLSLPDSYLFQKICAAEAEISRRVGVPLSPTEVFTRAPTDIEIAALNGGPYIVEPGYALEPGFFTPPHFGYLALRMRPVISISSLVLAYPNQDGATFNVPLSWLRLDPKYGQLHLYPSAQAISAPLTLFIMQAMGAGYTIPDMIQVRYRAGLQETDYPDVIDVTLRLALCRILGDAMLPQSASISADGLSQSNSIDVGKLQQEVERQISMLSDNLTGPTWTVL